MIALARSRFVEPRLAHVKLGKGLGFQLSELRQLIDALGSDERFCLAFQEPLEKKLSFVRRDPERLRRI